VAGFASWHEAHDVARRQLDRSPGLIGHCALETYSVLTRLPPPHRVRAAAVRDFLDARFPEPPLLLPPGGHRALIDQLAESGATGGVVYDALVAAVALAADATLVTLDRRATVTYQLLGARFEQLAV
jgi:hypothetical protein